MMPASSQPAAGARRQKLVDVFDRRWAAVMNWPGLLPGHRLGWFNLFFLVAEGRIGTIAITAEGLAACTGTRDGASGRRLRKSLVEAGLVDHVRTEAGGRFVLTLLDPLAVAAELRLRRGDPQVELEFPPELCQFPAADPPREDLHASAGGGSAAASFDPSVALRVAADESQTVSAPALRVAGDDCGGSAAAASASRTRENLGTSEESKISQAPKLNPRSSEGAQLGGGSAGLSGVTLRLATARANSAITLRKQPEPAAPIAGPLAELVGRWVDRAEDPVERQAAADRYAERIRASVGDPQLRLAPCLRVALAVLAGDVPQRELDELLADLRRRQAAAAEGDERAAIRKPWAYFVGATKKIFARHGQPWPAATEPTEARS